MGRIGILLVCGTTRRAKKRFNLEVCQSKRILSAVAKVIYLTSRAYIAYQ
jgi:hypothetical protein